MVGDTRIHGKRICTTRLVLETIGDLLAPFKIAVRTPRFTEASWAASQRRTGQHVGVAVADFVVLLRAVDGLPNNQPRTKLSNGSHG